VAVVISGEGRADQAVATAGNLTIGSSLKGAIVSIIVLFQQERADEAQDGPFVGEDTDHIGAPLDLAMKLGIEEAAMVRVRAGISYALTEARDRDIAACRPTDSSCWPGSCSRCRWN
jgi:hypothetical protein